MMRVFPITLTRAAKIWIDRIHLRMINTWDLLEKAFIQRYCPPSKTTKQLEEIPNFKQEGDETLYQAWESQFKTWKIIQRNEMMGLVTRGQADEIAAITSKLDSLGRDMKKLKENVHAIQVGYGLCGGTHLDKEWSLNEEIKGVEEVKYGESGRSFPINGGSEARYCIGPLGYYTRTNNRPPFGEMKSSLEETIYKYLEESAKKQSERDDWLKKF
ncbi:zinc knuckle CX2CX4HX4C containing protein [Tanacetum coccineum]